MGWTPSGSNPEPVDHLVCVGRAHAESTGRDVTVRIRPDVAGSGWCARSSSGSSPASPDRRCWVVLAHCDREPWRGGDAPDPRGEGHQRVRRGPHRDGGASHGRRGRGDVRPRGGPLLRPGAGVGSALPRPGGAGTRSDRERRRRRVARLGLRRRGPGVRGPVRPPRGRLHRAERGGHAPARRQDRLEAARRGGRRTGRTLESWCRGDLARTH